MRTGIGYDIHRLVPSLRQQSIPVGGVMIPCFFQVEAHSDGDVLLHALVDACLGALALGDIGQWFPDSQVENQKRSSAEFVEKVVSHIKRMGWEVYQFDSIVIAQEPRLQEHFDSIRHEIARLCRVELSCVSVKAKTAEMLGPIGERKAIAAHAMVTLREIKK